MKATIYTLISLCFSLLLLSLPADAQNVAGSFFGAGVSCAASNAGNSTLLIPSNGSRIGVTINNDSNTIVRIGGSSACNAPCTGAITGAVLSDSNSLVLNPGGTINDGPPGQYYNMFWCQSTTTVATTIHYAETRYP